MTKQTKVKNKNDSLIDAFESDEEVPSLAADDRQNDYVYQLVIDLFENESFTTFSAISSANTFFFVGADHELFRVKSPP